jgi:hypothetical protein
MIKEKKAVSIVTNKGNWVIDKENNVFIECYVTKDKRRILSLRGTARAINLKGGGGNAIARNLNSQWIQDYLSDGLKKWLEDIGSNNIETLAGVRKNIIPLDAELFVDICKAYVNAQRDGLFLDNKGKVLDKWRGQNEIANRLYMIMSAFAKVGIIALIDEITGYQEERERDEIQTLLSLYLTEERLAWAKMFPDEFYKQIYRLRNWTYPTGGNKTKRTPLLGRLTNELVYEKLPEGVLDELKNRNPVLSTTKRRKWKFTQFLSYDLGQPDLRNHLLQLVTIMRVSPNWAKFKRLFERAFPSRPEQTEMGFLEDEKDE